MNELMVTIGGGQYIYYKTREETADKAFQEFQEACDDMGINMDNLDLAEAILRDGSGEDIDSLSFG